MKTEYSPSPAAEAALPLQLQVGLAVGHAPGAAAAAGGPVHRRRGEDKSLGRLLHVVLHLLLLPLALHEPHVFLEAGQAGLRLSGMGITCAT